MAGPFHHDVRGDAEGQGVDDEGAAAGMGADELPLGQDLVGADVALVGGDADFLIDTGQLAQRVVRQGLVVLEGGVLVFFQNIPGDLVQLDGNAIRRLDGRDLDVVALNVAATKVVDIGVTEAGEAAEQEDVPDRIQVGLGFREFQVADAGDFLFSEVNDLPLRHLQGRVELLIVKVGVVSPVGGPVQEPAEIAQLLLDGIVGDLLHGGKVTFNHGIYDLRLLRSEAARAR